MRLLIQKVLHAHVKVDDRVTGKIGQGLLVFIGLEKEDKESVFQKAIDKLLYLRLWRNGEKGFDLNIQDVGGGILVVSQFTLLADTNKGSRPDFGRAMPANQAKIMYQRFMNRLKESYRNVEEGEFQAMMEVELVNDGPVTIMIDIK